VTEDYAAIRSYQRIFTPQRRIHQIEGHPLPIPGGVPLRWLAWAAGTLAAVIALSTGSPLVLVGAAAAAGAGGLAIADRTAGLLAAAAALAGTWLAGELLGVLGWPLRLALVPAAVATLATQSTPDGRRAERFAVSWLALRLAPARRSLGRSLPAEGVQSLAGELWVAPDERGARLRRARIGGPGMVFFDRPLSVRRRARRSQLVAAAPSRFAPRRRWVSRMELAAGEALEVRP
jgi:hypothetical protein